MRERLNLKERTITCLWEEIVRFIQEQIENFGGMRQALVWVKRVIGRGLSGKPWHRGREGAFGL